MEDQPSLTSPDGPSNRNTPERCPRPLDSQDSSKEDQEIHQDDQNSLNVVKVEHDDLYMMGDDPYKEEETPREISPDGSSSSNTPERCPRPLYSWYSPQEDQESSLEHQASDLTDVKVEIMDEDEPYEMGEEQCKDEVEEVPPEISTDGQYKRVPDLHPELLSIDPPPDLCPFTTNTRLKKFSCIECGKCFSQRTKLLAHERIHSGERPFSCSKCGKVFTQKAHLVTHEKIHSGEKPYSCPLCARCFTDKAVLARHQKFHSGEKPFSCSECGKCFTLKGDLVKHLRIHTGEKPYSCSYCGKPFPDKARLDRHELIHTGEKPYACSICGKLFALKAFLVTHERTHTDEKPYSCSVCGKCFTQKSNLATHERTHTGEKPFSCLMCGKSFTRKATLISHERCHR